MTDGAQVLPLHSLQGLEVPEVSAFDYDLRNYRDTDAGAVPELKTKSWGNKAADAVVRYPHRAADLLFGHAVFTSHLPSGQASAEMRAFRRTSQPQRPQIDTLLATPANRYSIF